MFWGNYIFEWYIDKNTLQPVWRNGCPTYRTNKILSEVYKVINNGREAVVVKKTDPIFKLPDKYRCFLRDVEIDFQGILKFEYTQADSVLVKEPGLQVLK